MLGALALGALCLMGNPPRRKRRRNPRVKGWTWAHAKARAAKRAKRRRRNPMKASQRRRILARVRSAARKNKRSHGSPKALYVSVMEQTRAGRMGLGRKGLSHASIAAAVRRGIHAARRNPRGKQNPLWDDLKIYAGAAKSLISSKMNAASKAWNEAVEAERKAKQAEAAAVKVATTVATVPAVASNPRCGKRRAYIAPGTAGARLAKWRWHHNP